VQEASADASALEGLLELVAWGDLGAERQAGLAPANLRQLVALAQACIDYLRGCAASSGAMLVSHPAAQEPACLRPGQAQLASWWSPSTDACLLLLGAGAQGEEMRQLQAESVDIPPLTTAVQEAHEALARMLRLLVKQRQAHCRSQHETRCALPP
jgi:hypothetical protein